MSIDIFTNYVRLYGWIELSDQDLLGRAVK